jgi:hypothetical protein
MANERSDEDATADAAPSASVDEERDEGGREASDSEGTPAGSDAETETDPADGGGWLVLAVLVVGVISLLLVGALLETPIAAQTTELGIGFAWLLAAAYVGFRVEGHPNLRLLSASAFVVAAIARFVGLLVPSALLEAGSIVALLVGALVMLWLAVE